MSSRGLPVAALLAAWINAGCMAEETAAPEAAAVAETAPPDVPRPALMVAGAAQARLLDIESAGERLVVVGQQGLIVISDDGKSWKQVPAPSSVMLTRAYFLDGQRGWAVGYDGTILHSADGALSWRLQHSDPDARMLYDVLFTDPLHGIAVGGYGAWYHTTDGGENWTPQSSPIIELGLHFNRLLRLDERTLLIVGERGMVARSSDAGEIWQMLRSPYAGSFFGAIALGGRSAMVFGMRGQVYVIEDLAAVPTQDPETYDPYAAETLAEPAAIAALGWRKLDSPIIESFFGGTRLPDGSVLLVGTNAVAVKSDAALARLTAVALPAAETLAQVQVLGERLVGVGRRGVQALGPLP